MADFAPYQDASPETSRALSPPLTQSKSPSPRASLDYARRGPAQHQHQASNGSGGMGPVRQESYFVNQGQGQAQGQNGGWGNGSGIAGGIAGGWGSGREDVDVFETSLGLRMDYEACLAYLLLPPAGGVLLLVLEHKSDYVRFHAWQSSLLFAFLFIVHIIFSWSSFISWLLFVCDMGLIGYLTFRAYKDADSLDRCEVPFFGPLASSILDDE